MDDRVRIINIGSKYLKIGMLLCLLIGFMSCNDEDKIVKPNDIINPGVYNRSILVDTMTRWYKLVIPPQYKHSEPRPLLFAFHGGGNSMAIFYNNRPDIIQRCEEENWILVFPNGSNLTNNRGQSTWNAIHCCNPSLRFDVDEVGFVRKMVDELSAELKIDASRIYATGGSNGALLVNKLAGEAPDIFAASSAVSGNIGGQLDSLSPVVTVQAKQPIPFMMVHGLNDKNVVYTGGRSKTTTRIDISFEESALFWAKNNQCDISQPDTTIEESQKGKVWTVTFNKCISNKEVKAITIENWGHGWPDLENSGFDATNTIIDFLKKFSK